MCCPHLKVYINSFLKQVQPHIPVHVLPPRMYGMMRIEELYQDAKDIIALYQQTPMNPVFFPGEENIMRVARAVAYRNVT